MIQYFLWRFVGLSMAFMPRKPPYLDWNLKAMCSLTRVAGSKFVVSWSVRWVHFELPFLPKVPARFCKTAGRTDLSTLSSPVGML